MVVRPKLATLTNVPFVLVRSVKKWVEISAALVGSQRRPSAETFAGYLRAAEEWTDSGLKGVGF